MTRFIEGARLRLEFLDGNKHEYVISSRKGSVVKLDSLLVEGRTIELSQEELISSLSNSRLELIRTTSDEDKKLAQDLMAFPEEVREEALRRYRYPESVSS